MKRVDHDRLFKLLLQTFFREFIVLFFPELDRLIDYRQIKFLSEEVFTDIVAGKKGRVDILVEVRLRGEHTLMIVHIENQAYVDPDFPERMFLYACRLYEKYRRRILPIAIFSYDAFRDEPDRFGWKFPFLEVMRFRYRTIELRKKKWREYVVADNPVAAALLSKMGYNKRERVRVRLEFLRMLVRMELDPAKLQLLSIFFETYLKLNAVEERILRDEMKNLPEEARVVELMTSWEKKGWKEGKKEGKEEGKKEGKKEIAKNMLNLSMDIELIMKVTGLSEREVQSLKPTE